MKKTKYEILRFKRKGILYIIEWPSLILSIVMIFLIMFLSFSMTMVFFSMINALRGLIYGTHG